MIFINDFLKYVPAGVEVPGVKQGKTHCPGLLFADDIAGLSETEESATAFLAGVTAWSRAWKMPMGAQKCGVMMVGGTEEEQEALKAKAFEVDNQRVEVVRKYKYLGIWVTDSLGDNKGTDEIAHCHALAAKIKVATDMRRSFLRDAHYPLDLKVAVINSKIASVGCYGGEWIGLCQARTDIVQKILNVALKLVLNSSSKSTMHGTKVMSMELGVPTIEQRMADMRIRLWQKARKMRTWIATLRNNENRLRSRSRVWTSQTLHLLSTPLPKWDTISGELELAVDSRA